MNDENSALLVDHWLIPDYAQSMIWLQTDSEIVQTEGAQGLFTLHTPAQKLIVRWGGADGPALAVLRWQPDNLAWDGTIKIGGYVDSLHLTQFPDVEIPVGILAVGGQPLQPSILPYPPAVARARLPYTSPDFFAAVDDEVDETPLLWLLPEDSPLITMAENALLNKLRVWCFGRLAEQQSGWHQHIALPLLLEAITLFAS